MSKDDKKSKKDKKQNKDNKEKKSKKKSGEDKKRSKKSDRKKDEKSLKKQNLIVDPTISNNIAKLLSYMIVSYPRAHDDFPNMISSLDQNQLVLIDSISDCNYRQALNELFSHLPLTRLDEKGWKKKNDIVSLAGYILQALLEQDYIVQPGDLSLSQSSSVRIAAKILTGGSKSNDAKLLRDSATRQLKKEVLNVFQQLLSGNVTKINEINHEDIAMDVENILYQLNLERILDDYGNSEFRLSSGSSSYDESHNVIKYLMDGLTKSSSLPTTLSSDTSASISNQQSISSSLNTKSHSTIIQENNPNGNQSVAEKLRASLLSKKNPNTIGSDKSLAIMNSSSSSSSSSSSASSSSNSDSNSDDQEDENIGPKGPQIIGPAKHPSKIDSNITQKARSNSDSSSESDEEMGPVPQMNVSDVKETSASFLYTSSQASSGKDLMSDSIDLLSSSKESSLLMKRQREVEPNEKLNGQCTEGEREDWMLTPGMSKSIEEVMGLGGQGFGVTRKFLDSKGAKKLALSINQQNEDREPTAEEIRNQQILAEYREKRGASLFEAHLQNKSGPSKKSGKDSNSQHYFDRERDMSNHRPLDSKGVQDLVSQAKQMDSRFSRGGIQRSI